MKTNKLWSIMMMLVLTLSMAVIFSSCSKDDDDNSSVGNSIVGTWYEPVCEYTFVFNKDKSFSWNQNGSIWKGTYTFGNNIVTMTYKINGETRTSTRIVTYLDARTMTWMERDGWSYTLTKR